MPPRAFPQGNRRGVWALVQNEALVRQLGEGAAQGLLNGGLCEAAAREEPRGMRDMVAASAR